MLRLQDVRLNKYKCFLTEQEVSIAPQINWLIGKNEAGKTAFLEALMKFHYFDRSLGERGYEKVADYPRSELKPYERDYPDNDYELISCGFEMDEQLFDAIAERFGEGVLTSRTLRIGKRYNNEFSPCELALSEAAEEAGLGPEICEQMIMPHLPRFWYFDEYYMFPHRLDLEKYRDKEIDEQFTREQYDVIHALFKLSGVEVEKLIQAENHEAYIAELEATSNALTDQFLSFWSTNQNLEIQYDIQVEGGRKFLNIRVRNTQHRLTLPLNKRSKGFIRFFSFLVWFSSIEQDERMILLLDEPGLNFHAEAQRDLLRLIRSKMQAHQVICSTHSPFLIDAAELEGIRCVVSTNDPKRGSVITKAEDETDPGTIFPLQAALGYALSKRLADARKTLFVSDVAEVMLLRLLAEQLRQKGYASLDAELNIVPIGDLNKISLYQSLKEESTETVSLFGRAPETPAPQSAAERLLYEASQVLFYDEILPKGAASIEDFFSRRDLRRILNGTGLLKQRLGRSSLDEDSPVLPQLEGKLQDRYDRQALAHRLLQKPRLLRWMNRQSLERFGQLFMAVMQKFA